MKFYGVLVLVFSQAVYSESHYSETIDGTSFVMKRIPQGFYEKRVEKTDVTSFSNFGETVKSFYLAETETTWSLYQRCIDQGACPDNEADGGDNGWGKVDRPVIEVSWDDINGNFIPWLNSKTGKVYRLPTELEWEYAASGGRVGKYSWGDVIECSQARYGFVAGDCGKIAKTSKVKQFKANGFGLYDMHGNVWEYVQDCWDKSVANASSCNEFVLKGGSWLNEANALAIRYRFRHKRHYRESGDGFRLARSLEKPQ